MIANDDVGQKRSKEFIYFLEVIHSSTSKEMCLLENGRIPNTAVKFRSLTKISIFNPKKCRLNFRLRVKMSLYKGSKVKFECHFRVYFLFENF